MKRAGLTPAASFAGIQRGGASAKSCRSEKIGRWRRGSRAELRRVIIMSKTMIFAQLTMFLKSTLSNITLKLSSIWIGVMAALVMRHPAAAQHVQDLRHSDWNG
jgi:hypothetical protein